MSCKSKRPIGRPPIGARWLKDEGRYEYTQQYFDLREQTLISNRLKAKEKAKATVANVKTTLPEIWDKTSVKKEDTLDQYITRVGRAEECNDT